MYLDIDAWSEPTHSWTSDEDTISESFGIQQYWSRELIPQKKKSGSDSQGKVCRKTNIEISGHKVPEEVSIKRSYFQPGHWENAKVLSKWEPGETIIHLPRELNAFADGRCWWPLDSNIKNRFSVPDLWFTKTNKITELFDMSRMVERVPKYSIFRFLKSFLEMYFGPLYH